MLIISIGVVSWMIDLLWSCSPLTIGRRRRLFLRLSCLLRFLHGLSHHCIGFICQKLPKYIMKLCHLKLNISVWIILMNPKSKHPTTSKELSNQRNPKSFTVNLEPISYTHIASKISANCSQSRNNICLKDSFLFNGNFPNILNPLLLQMAGYSQLTARQHKQG